MRRRQFIALSVARPQANITGVANVTGDITSKRIPLLGEIAPLARRCPNGSRP